MSGETQNSKANMPQVRDLTPIAGGGILLLLVKVGADHFQVSMTTVLQWLVAGLGGIAVVIFSIFLLRQRKRGPMIKGPQLHIGKWISSGIFRFERLASIPLQNLRHILITGVTGSGKSTLIRRMIGELNRLHRGYLYIDFKGEQRELDEIIQSIRVENRERELQIFDLSRPEICAKCNLLTLFSGIEETVGFTMQILELEHPHYRDLAEELLTNSLRLLDATEELRSFIHIRRISTDAKYRNSLLRRVPSRLHEEEFFHYFENSFNLLDDRSREERFTGYHSRLSALTQGVLRDILNAKESAFDITHLFESNRPTIIRIPGEAYGELSKRIVKAFIQALPALIGKRRIEQKPKDYFIFMDEQCSYMSETVIDILKKAGSAKVHCVVTRQSDGDFARQGDGFMSQMISTCSVTFNFQILDAETRDSTAKQLGTTVTQKHTKRISQGQETGELSEREVHQFEIPPDTFLHLPPGECIVSCRLPFLNFVRRMKVIPLDLTEKEDS